MVYTTYLYLFMVIWGFGGWFMALFYPHYLVYLGWFGCCVVDLSGILHQLVDSFSTSLVKWFSGLWTPVKPKYGLLHWKWVGSQTPPELLVQIYHSQVGKVTAAKHLVPKVGQLPIATWLGQDPNHTAPSMVDVGDEYYIFKGPLNDGV